MRLSRTGVLEADDRGRFSSEPTTVQEENPRWENSPIAYVTDSCNQGVGVNACHPGDVKSTLSNNLGFGGHQSPEEGVDTPAWLAIGSAGTETTGRYFENCRAVPCGFSKDRNTMERLFEACGAYSRFIRNIRAWPV